MRKYNYVKALIISIIITGCSADKQNKNQGSDIQTVPVTELVASDTVLVREYVADIQAVRNVEIQARVPGFLVKISVDEGQAVKKGQVLFQINDEEYKADYAHAKANLSNAIAEAKADELELDRVNILVDKKVISNTERAAAKAKLTAARAKIDEASSLQTNAAIRLSYTTIRSPFDGVINRIPLKIGSLVGQGSLLTTVSDVGGVYAYFHVSENEYLQYAKRESQGKTSNNTVVQLVLADGTPYAYPGKIETVEGEFDESTGSIAFRARFSNPDRLLKHGSTGRVLIESRVSNVVLVPQKAVFELQDKDFVLIVDSAGKVQTRSFTPRARLSHFYVVASGLKPGDRIVCEGVQNIRDGARISPQYVRMDTLLAQSRL